MTTAERDAITDPANALLVFDTDLNGYYFNDGTPASPDWTLLLTETESRDNYVIVKSEDDFPTASGGTITLDENTLYEINGTISTSNSINVNGAYLIGKDTNEDIINYTGSGSLFTGSSSASLRNLTFDGGNTGELFGVSGGASDNLIAQSIVVKNFNSVGSVSGYGLVFFNVIQYLNNSNGVTYTSIGNLLLNNQAWLPTNAGTYETLTGTFGFVEKVSGFSTVSSGNTGLDVSANPTVGEGVIQSVVFSGAGTYVNPYSVGNYSEYNFNSDWYVTATGIPDENDDVATGNIYFDGDLTTGYSFTVSNGNPFSTTTNASTTAVNLYRFSSPQDGRLTYEGNKPRTFQVNASLSERVTSASGEFYAFFIAKNGTPLEETNSVQRILNDNDVQSVSITGTVEMENGDYIEIWGERLTGSGSDTIVIFSSNLNIN